MQFQTDTHTHTIVSGHAYSTLLENCAAARAAGIKLMAVTDHAPSMPGAPYYWYFNNLRVLPSVLEGVGVLRGAEANILDTQGGIDLFPETTELLDVVIGSLHEPVFSPKSEAEHTQALIGAIESGQINILGHLGNPNFPFDIDHVVKAAAKHKVMIEINNSSFVHSRAGSDVRCAQIAESARDYGAYLTFGSDAHFCSYIGRFDACIEVIQRVNFPMDRLVSTHAAKLLDYLADGGKMNLDRFDEVR
jgi:putative hydrolase